MDENDNCQVSKPEAVARAKTAFESVFTNGSKIELDHHLVYHALKFHYHTFMFALLIPTSDYELGRLMSREGDDEAAKTQFDLVLSGKPLEVNASGRKGKYSMEACLSSLGSMCPYLRILQQALHMRTHAAIDALGQHRPL